MDKRVQRGCMERSTVRCWCTVCRDTLYTSSMCAWCTVYIRRGAASQRVQCDRGIPAVSYRRMSDCVGPKPRKKQRLVSVGLVGAAYSGSPERAAPVAPASQACVRSIHWFSNGTASFDLSNALLVQIFAIVSISTSHYGSSAIETAD